MTDDKVARAFQVLFEQLPSLHVHIDGRAAGLDVPEHLLGTEEFVFQYGRGIGIPTTHTFCKDQEGRLGLQCTLQFGPSTYVTFVPCAAIQMIVGDTGRMHGSEPLAAWIRDGYLDRFATSPTVPAPAPIKSTVRPKLTLIKGGKS